MNQFLLRLLVYFISFALSLYGLSAFDYNRFLKYRVDPRRAQVLYVLIAIALAYLVGQFFMAVMYSFYNQNIGGY